MAVSEYMNFTVLLKYLGKCRAVLQFEFKDGAFELLSVARPSKYQALPFVEKFAKNFYVKCRSTYE